MYAELFHADDSRSAVINSCWMPIPTETSAGGPCGEVEPVRPGRAQERAEVVPAQREVVEQAVIEGELLGGVKAHAVDAVGREEAVHRAGVPLTVHGVPGMADVRGREAREFEWAYGSALAVGLRIAGWDAELTGERRETIVMIERAVLLAVDDDVLQRCPAGLAGGSPGEGWTRRHNRSNDAGPAERSGALQEGPAADALVHGESGSGFLPIACGSRSHIASEVVAPRCLTNA